MRSVANVEYPLAVNTNRINRRSSRWWLLGVCALLPNLAGAAVAFPPTIGTQSAENRYQPRFVSVYRQDFEGALGGVNLLGQGISVTTAPGEVIDGRRSIKISGASVELQIQGASLGLEAYRTYVVQVAYRVVSAGPGPYPFIVRVDWPGLQDADSGTLGAPQPVNGSQGTFAVAVRTADVAGATVHINSTGALVILDNVEIFRHDFTVVAAEPQLPATGFPRLSKYIRATPEEIADTLGTTTPEVEKKLALFDLINGLDIDHTLGLAGLSERLRALNPKTILLPYFNAQAAQLFGARVFGGSAGLPGLFEAGLQEGWFMHDPAGNRLEEVYPTNFQMNVTAFGEVSDGTRYTDYVDRYLARSVMPSGLWDGVHLDEVLWYPNSLLGDGNPFLGGEAALPPIDIDNDGQADSDEVLYQAWNDGFYKYFGDLVRDLGPAVILFGNAGEIPLKKSVLAHLNGMQREFMSPYARDPNGDWITANGAVWHRMMSQLDLARRFLRAPQLPSFEFTGHGLGTLTGNNTGNGVPDRTPDLEPRDYLRARFGLASVLMGDAYFGYDLVDNTSPPVWIDEFAVDASGTAVQNLAGKGYLGQPLGDALELDYPHQVLARVDFENGIQAPPGILLGPNVVATSVAAEVIDGSASGRLSVTAPGSGDTSFIFINIPSQLPLEVGQTYQLSLDYRVIDYAPFAVPRKDGFLAVGVFDQDSTTGEKAPYRFASLSEPDPGQTGHLRTSVAVDSANFLAVAAVTEGGTVVVDNIELIKGSGGVYRRDFEHGIVLVNPTPVSQVINQGEVAGPLGRTGIRRILGSQAPLVNDGSPVTAGIMLAAGDGIILLADNVMAAPPGRPDSVTAVASGNQIDVTWSAASGTTAGYIVRYGIAGGDLTRFEAIGRRTNLALTGLDSGTSYEVEVTAVDYLGNPGPVSARAGATTAGAPPARPTLTSTSPLSPGSFAIVTGINLAAGSSAAPSLPLPASLDGVSVLINGIPAPIRQVSANSVVFSTPYEIGGARAIVRVERSGISSVARFADVVDANPGVLVWDQAANAIAFRVGTQSLVNAASPAAAGDRIALLATGIGMLEPRPDNGALAGANSKMWLPGRVLIGNSRFPAEVVGSGQFESYLGVFTVEFVVPAGIAPGLRDIRLEIGTQVSTPVKLAF